ncbi:MAG: M20/M25/M40 family metallo-hydrolase [Flavisolibacter sp.]|nr:M20/M25/M40 family metallo-hydrolase [Flavisolibacter sp.]MBD0294617.1 M20/M25/M40 family metallo-hydrolase [Flavisolibacter sp.]MBD0349767.1 M20/M25/M40 family metallo-hydrolase [Flavisolibacter sp.]
MRRTILFILILLGSLAQAQKLKKEDKQLLANLQKHVEYLASDALEGRRTGTAGEKKAAAYIAEQFKSIGLLPKGTQEYLQPFEIAEGNQINPTTHLIVDERNLVAEKEFIPLHFSANASLEALPSLALQEAGSPWFWDVKDLLQAHSGNPHFDVYEAIRNKAEEVQKKGATALFVYNSGSTDDGITFLAKEHSEPASIPVVYLTKEAMKKYFNDVSATYDIKLKTSIGPKSRNGTNVIGYIDNGASTTVVMGAHFDHLGYGEDNNSLFRTGEKQVHNGADDNASGTAALLELARLLKNSKLTNNNYLFIAFSGEELGLYGSKYFVEHPTVDISKVNFMINMDMVGRLNDSTRTVTVGGFGTSPAWAQAYNLSGRQKLYSGDLLFRYDSSGTGPSDHTSFYLKNIPVLFYFTGLHSDYHRPTDDFNKVNYSGELQVVKHIYSLLEWQNKMGNRLAFAKTRETQMGTGTRFSVTLGIMPDYTFSGAGVRVDGVSENRPAQKAGLQAGDVIVQLGDYPVSSVETYMQALNKFKKGDKTMVQYNRGAEKRSAAVEF